MGSFSSLFLLIKFGLYEDIFCNFSTPLLFIKNSYLEQLNLILFFICVLFNYYFYLDLRVFNVNLDSNLVFMSDLSSPSKRDRDSDDDREDRSSKRHKENQVSDITESANPQENQVSDTTELPNQQETNMENHQNLQEQINTNLQEQEQENLIENQIQQENTLSNRETQNRSFIANTLINDIAFLNNDSNNLYVANRERRLTNIADNIRGYLDRGGDLELEEVEEYFLNPQDYNRLQEILENPDPSSEENNNTPPASGDNNGNPTGGSSSSSGTSGPNFEPSQNGSNNFN